MSQMPLKIGVVGAGKFGTLHGGKYYSRSDCIISGVFDPDIDAARVLGAKLESPIFADYRDLLNHSDAIVVATPASYHAKLALEALKQGCHVFIEKPVALNLADADALIDMADDNKLTLQIGHQERYLVEALGLLSLSQSPKMIKCCRCMPATGRGEDVSAIMDLMIHDLDIIMCFSGDEQPVISLDAQFKNNADQASLNFEFPQSGIIATCKVSRRSEERERSLELHFDDGILHIDFLTKRIKNETSLLLQSDFSHLDNLAISDPLAYGAQSFIRAIINRNSPVIDGRAGRRALDIALKAEAVLMLSQHYKSSLMENNQYTTPAECVE